MRQLTPRCSPTSSTSCTPRPWPPERTPHRWPANSARANSGYCVTSRHTCPAWRSPPRYPSRQTRSTRMFAGSTPSSGPTTALRQSTMPANCGSSQRAANITRIRRQPFTVMVASFGHTRTSLAEGVLMSDVTSIGGAGDRRWLILGVLGLAQVMVIMSLTVMNIALLSAQQALHFSTVDRQWVVTAYTLAFGSLLLLGGASINFTMLITARACQGVFAALLVPSALSLLITTFTEPKDRSRAFAVYGAIAGAGGAIGLLLGGALTEYLSWRWTLYVNLIFAGVAFTGGALLLTRQPSPARPRLDIPGVLLEAGGMFCLVYGFANAASHSWATPSTYGFLAAGVALLAGFAAWQARAAHPLLPPRVVLDRNRSGAYLSMLFVSAGLFGTFLFLTYYLQQTLGYSPLVTGVAFLPLSGGIIVAANLSTIVLMPRVGPKPLVATGMLAAAGGAAWLAQLGPHSGYATGVLGPVILASVGLGMVIAPVINTGTFGVAPQDAGVASAAVTEA